MEIKRTKKRLLFIALLVTAMSLNAQTIIKGRITDSKESLPFVSIAIVNDSTENAKILDGTTTNDKGEFAVKVKTLRPIIRISFVGYKTKTFAVAVKDYKKYSDGSINIGDVNIEPTSETLDAVSIVGKQTRLEMNNDKLVVNVDEGLSATSANVFEMLRKVPGVVIDKDENLTLNGKSGILFQWDGRDIKLPWNAIKAILKGMSPNDIAKIETITNPSSKYEAEGTAGIINIIMTKQQTEGFSGNANSWLGINKDIKTNESLSLNYVNNRWTISGNIGYGDYDSRTSIEMEQYIYGFLNDTICTKMDKTTNKYSFRTFNTNLNADYKIDNNNSIGAMLSFNRSYMPRNQNDIKFNIYSSPLWQLDSSYNTKGGIDNSSYDYLGSIYYNHKFDSLGGQYSFSLDFSRDDNTSTSKINNYYYNNMSTPLRRQYINENTDNTNSSYSIKFDVNQPFNEKISLEYGLKSRLAVIDNDFKAYEDNVLNLNTTNNLKYKENVNAAYISFSDKISQKFSFRTGIRFEHTYTYIEQKSTNDKITDNYFNLFPNLNLNMKVGKMDNISLTYSYRISRPDYNSLNPFVSKVSGYMYSSGNPYLDPQYTHNISLNYAFHYIIFLTAGYSYTHDYINQAFFTTPNSIIITQKPYNLGYKQNVNIGISSMLPLGPVEWTIWMQGAYQQMHCDDKLLKTNMERFTFQTWQSLSIDLFFKSKLTASIYYATGGIERGGEYDDMLMLSASLSKDFLKKSLKVSIGVDNFPKRDFHVDTYHNSYKMNMDMCWQRPMFTINATYNFGKSANNNTLKRIKSDDMDNRVKAESQQEGPSLQK